MIATALGSFAGTGMAATIRAVLGVFPDRAPLPELPDRGPHASMFARTMCLLEDLPFDRQPAGWRLSLGPSILARRARRTLLDDIDVLAENIDDWPGRLTITTMGPWTLSACVDLPRGGRSIGDPGARRDICQAWGAALDTHLAWVRRVIGAPVAVQIDEPCLGQVLTGVIPDESGRHSLPPVEEPEVRDALGAAIAQAKAAGGDIVVVHCCDDELPLGVILDSGADAPSIDTAVLRGSSWDRLAQWCQQGRQAWLGVVPTHQMEAGSAFMTRQREEVCSRLELDEQEREALVLTPACGLAGVERSVAWRSLAELAKVARG
ncbi:Cobalamin-independent synthase, Catalytic domain [Propionibacterium cyclohexanicum]|uniref:Cobalamin-independent synthase, Catalytic domain n=1 Tax=Propionibacterium cyclohexanicum TaxID=64702 RepID=A0A1H9R1U0_9ACTN|nr:methionine synthase [Propionibacterium cyclohexanicum]SER66668.1 Cobalamin-independent synthase, Catalytic domain [Propionibacterium cyclohexanicum]